MKRRVVAAIAALGCLTAACGVQTADTPRCNRPEDEIFILEAQSVPSSTRLPCLAELPAGWDFGGSLVKDTETTLWLDHDRAGIHALEVTMTASCDIAEAVEIPPSPDEVGMRVYQKPTSLDPSFIGSRYLVFPGGCIAHHYAFSDEADPTLVIEADLAISTVARSDVVAQVRDSLDLTLCGAEAPPCAG